MKILFFMRHPGYTRNFESTLRLLAERGHHVHMAFDRRERAIAPGMVDALVAEYPNISHGPAPGRENDGWTVLVQELRLGFDYLRYLEPRYRDAHKLRARADSRAPGLIRRLAAGPLGRSWFGLRRLGTVLRVLEQAVPNSRRVDDFLREHRPDIVLVTPLVDLASSQPDYVRGAWARGIRTGLCVASWDNLTNKGLIQHVPDFVTVWNQAQKDEAVQLHGVAAERVIVTGAEAYDHWFDWAPSTTRAEFCDRVGLPQDRPFILYLCSSPFIAPREASFVLDWLGRLRGGSHGGVQGAGVLIRPHPQNAAQWGDVDVEVFGNVALWPRSGANPVTDRSKADFYDSIYHSAAVVGVNTSALIETAIVGRPVYTLLAPEFRDTQEGTLHFHHLLDVNGGLLHVARSHEEHAAQLAQALAGGAGRDERGQRFLEAFVRPHGLDVPATPKVVEAIEAACAAPRPDPRVAPPWAVALRLILAPVAYCALLRQIWRERRKLPRRLRLRVQRLRRHELSRRARPVARRVRRCLRRLASGRIGRHLRPRSARRTARRVVRSVLALSSPRRARQRLKRLVTRGMRRTLSAQTTGRLVRGAGGRAASATTGRLWLRLKQLLVDGIERSLRVPAVRGFARRAFLPALTSGTVTLARGLAVTEPGLSAGTPPDSRQDDSVAEAVGAVVRTLHENGTAVNLAGLSGEALHSLLRPARERETPIVAGPWVGEVGFEVLYWIPFVRWITEQEPWIKDRLVILSRGGSAHWYQGISSRYVDLYDHVSPGELWEQRQRNAPIARSGRPKDKQFEMAAWERELVDGIRQRRGLGDVDVIHPSVMFQALRQLQRQEAIPRIRATSRYCRLERPEVGPLAGMLPERYVTAKFYFSAAFPDTSENRAFIASMLRTLTQSTNVVLLNTGLLFDDHWDFEAAVSDRLFKIDHLMVATNNLHIQTIAISRAQAFVGTYGGLSYLPPFFGIPSLSFYSRPDQFAQHHLDLAQRVFRGPNWGTYLALHTDHLDLVRSIADVRLATSP